MFAVLFPITASDFVVHVFCPFLFSYGCRYPIFAGDVFFLVPLRFLVALRTFFPAPCVPIQLSHSVGFVVGLRGRSFFHHFQYVVKVERVFQSFFVFDQFCVNRVRGWRRHVYFEVGSVEK